MAQRYAVIESGAWTGTIVPRPASYNNTALAANASDDIFRSLGLWPILVDDPGPSSEWEERAGIQHTVNTTDETVTETIEYALVEVDQRQVTMQQQAEGQYNTVLRNGFDDGTGTVWPATKDARDRILDLTQHIQEFRAGTMTNELPGSQGKTTVRLQDTSGNLVNADSNKIIELADKGSNFKEDVQDRLEQLIGQIMAASSHSDLDDINITTGWPT